MDEDVTVDGIRNWQKEPITQLFFEHIQELMEGCDKAVHLALMSPETTQNATLENAGLNQLIEVIELPNQMVEDLKEEKGE